MNVTLSHLKQTETVEPTLYLNNYAIFKVKNLTKAGVLAQLDSFVLNEGQLPPIKKWFISYQILDIVSPGDYLLGQITKVDFLKSQFTFTYVEHQEKIKGFMLKLCEICMRGYYHKNKDYVCTVCGNTKSFLQKASIHYGLVLTTNKGS